MTATTEKTIPAVARQRRRKNRRMLLPKRPTRLQALAAMAVGMAAALWYAYQQGWFA